jgi:FkbM family methyltransferase
MQGLICERGLSEQYGVVGMNKLEALEHNFKNGDMTKDDYIHAMYALHLSLWDYSAFIKNKNIVAITISGNDVTVKTKGGMTFFYGRDDERAIPLEIMNFDDYEHDELAMVQRLVNEKSVIIDIGAHAGWYSVHLAKRAIHGRILCFEPIPATLALLKKNIAVNNITNITIYEQGLSDTEGEGVFYYEPGLSVATSLRNLHDERKKQTVKCPVKTLDNSLPRDLARVDLIKCDVEGAELLVLRGAGNTIKEHMPVLFLEMLRKWAVKFDYHPNDIIDHLQKFGYSCHFVKKGFLIPLAAITEKTVATNFCFLHKEKHVDLIASLVDRHA